MEVFTSQNEDNSDLMKDVSEDVSLDPLVLISNLNKRFKREEVSWKYNNRSQHVSIKTGKHSYVLQIPFSLGNLFGLEESDVEFVNTMTTSHELLGQLGMVVITCLILRLNIFCKDYEI